MSDNFSKNNRKNKELINKLQKHIQDYIFFQIILIFLSFKKWKFLKNC